MGVYSVYIVGGWSVNLGQFSLRLIEINGAEIIKTKKVNLRIQSYFKNKRTKKVFSYVIYKSGTYRIEFENQNTLIIKKSILSLRFPFQNKINSEKIDILLEKE